MSNPPEKRNDKDKKEENKLPEKKEKICPFISSMCDMPTFAKLSTCLKEECELYDDERDMCVIKILGGH